MATNWFQLLRLFEYLSVLCSNTKFLALSYFHNISPWADVHWAVARALIIDTELKLFALREHIEGTDAVPRAVFKDEKSAVLWLTEKGLSDNIKSHFK